MYKRKPKKIKSLLDLKAMRDQAIKEHALDLRLHPYGMVPGEKLIEDVKWIRSIEDLLERRRQRNKGSK